MSVQTSPAVARDRLKKASAAIAGANAALAALPATASAEERVAAEKLVADAKAEVIAAQAALAAIPKPPKPAPVATPKVASTNTSPATTTTAGSGGGASAAPANERPPKDADVHLVAALAVHGVRWMGRSFEPGEPIEPLLPKPIFDSLEAENAVSLIE